MRGCEWCDYKKMSGCYINHYIGLSIWQIDRIMSADVFWC